MALIRGATLLLLALASASEARGSKHVQAAYVLFESVFFLNVLKKKYNRFAWFLLVFKCVQCVLFFNGFDLMVCFCWCFFS